MKKFIAVIAVVIAMVTMLTACGKFTCDLCQQEKSGKKTKITVDGETGVFCKDCKDTAQALADLANAFS